jgi:uncharacterized SAM-binding protein YcdF (DUF218 family)
MLMLTKALGILLTPPGVVVILAALGLLLQRRWRYLGSALLWTSVAILLILSMPITGNALLGALEKSVVALTSDNIRAPSVDAIVVLGGGRDADQPQYDGDTVSSFTLERLRYAARLQRATNLPILVSGGTVFGERAPEAELMRQTLARDFQVPVTWIEDRSRNTLENAVYSGAILAAAGKKKVWLVTDAWHMPRALWAFHHADIGAVAAPTGFTRTGERTLLDFLPSSRGLYLSSLALHERLGLTWYRWRDGVKDVQGKSALPLPFREASRGDAKGLRVCHRCRGLWAGCIGHTQGA